MNNGAVRVSAANGHMEMVKYLVARGANVRDDNDYALVWAAASGHLEMVKYLVSHGANVRAQDDKALRLSSTHARLAVINYLVYEVCYGITREFEFKCKFVLLYLRLPQLREEYTRRGEITNELKAELPNASLTFRLRPSSLHIRAVGKWFGIADFCKDRSYWE